MARQWTLLLALLVWTPTTALWAGPGRSILATLVSGHPRLILGRGEDVRVRETIARHPEAAQWWAKLRREAVRMLAEPPVEHIAHGSDNLLDQSRKALRRIELLALLYRVEGDGRWFERARREMLAVATFPDWGPSHFLDVAEMTHAVAIGYDWLHGSLNAADRRTIKEALVRLGLRPGLSAYRTGVWWTRADHNWNQVCSGGLAMGALAVADEEPILASELLQRAVEAVRIPMRHYAPDGGWPEGPGYWNYGTSYQVDMLASLTTALGTDFGLSDAPGFAQTGLFRTAYVGPTRRVFNFADSPEHDQRSPALFWLAHRFAQPLYAWTESHSSARPHPLDLVWYESLQESPVTAHVPLCQQFLGVSVAFLRTSWFDPMATFVGIKGGYNAANHSHLDLGTFVMDALGERWALDLGPDDYGLPGYFQAQRPTYYRIRTEGHNTLTLNGTNQDLHARAPIVAFSDSPELSFVVLDLSQAYMPRASVFRGLALLPGGQVLVQDEVAAREPVAVVWGMHTAASIALDGRVARLSQGGHRLVVRLLEPPQAHLDVDDPVVSPREHPVKPVRRLVARLPSRVTAVRLAVLLTPVVSGPIVPPPTPGDELPLTPLSSWHATH